MIKNPETKLLIEKVDNLQKTIDRFYEDFIEDRRFRGDMEIVLKGVATTANMLREDNYDQTREIKRAVKDSTEEVIKPMENKVNRLFKSKSEVLHYIEENKKGILQRLFFWQRK